MSSDVNCGRSGLCYLETNVAAIPNFNAHIDKFHTPINFMSNSFVQSQIKGKSKETMRKAYLGARAKVKDTRGSEETNGVGSVSAMVIDGEKLVLANMGDYRAIVCRDGLAHEIGSRHKQSPKGSWSHKLFKGMCTVLQLCISRIVVAQFIHRFYTRKVHILMCDTGNAASNKQSKSSDLVVGAEKIENNTEFVILASSGIWEVCAIILKS